MATVSRESGIRYSFDESVNNSRRKVDGFRVAFNRASVIPAAGPYPSVEGTCEKKGVENRRDTMSYVWRSRAGFRGWLPMQVETLTNLSRWSGRIRRPSHSTPFFPLFPPLFIPAGPTTALFCHLHPPLRPRSTPTRDTARIEATETGRASNPCPGFIYEC